MSSFPTEALTEQTILAKVRWRILPLLYLSYVIAYIDRINVGFAKLHLREALKVDEAVFGTVFGIGAGIFFLGYFLFEIPSNLILQRVGARIWIARIMIIWGIVSTMMMFIHSTTYFYVMRFLLGVAEAGFYPGVILYLTYWFPAKERARTVAFFSMAGVLAGAIGSPLSGAILGMKGVAGLTGWQWLFLLEGIPAVLIGLVVLVFLPNGPKQAKWLDETEKNLLQTRLNEESARTASQQHHLLRDAFTSGTVWLLAFLYFLLNCGGYGFELWSPSIVKSFSGKSDFVVGLINMIPFIVAAVAMIWAGHHSDHRGERRGFIALGAFASAIGFALSAYFHNPYLTVFALSLALAGLKSALGPFWAVGTGILRGTAAAGGIALINSVGNLGGYVGPRIIGAIKDRTGSDTAALPVLGGALLLMGLLAFALPKARNAASNAA